LITRFHTTENASRQVGKDDLHTPARQAKMPTQWRHKALLFAFKNTSRLWQYFGPPHNIGPDETEPQIEGKGNAEQRHNTALELKEALPLHAV
jgi:hypothetical protein